MARYIIKLDGFDLGKLLKGEPLKCKPPNSPVDEIIIKTTPNAILNLKSLIDHSASISHPDRPMSMQECEV